MSAHAPDAPARWRRPATDYHDAVADVGHVSDGPDPLRPPTVLGDRRRRAARPAVPPSPSPGGTAA